MPLPFLTADRAFEAADEAPLPFDHQERWRRPYRPGPWRVAGAAVCLLLSSYVLFAGVVIALTGSPAQAALIFALALLVIGATLRLLRMGVWVSADGLRQVGFFTTRTAAWDQVAALRTVQQPVRWLGLPRTVQGQALTLVRRDQEARGAVVLLTTHGADFLARSDAFGRAADEVVAWGEDFRRG